MIGVISSQHRGESEIHECTLPEYIARMKDIRTGSRYLDTLTFKKSAVTLEQEITNLRHMYEQEITRLREEVKSATSSVFQQQRHCQQMEESSTDNRQKIEDDIKRNTELEDSCAELRNAINLKQQELMQLEFSQRQQASNPAVSSEGQLAKASQENSRLKKMLAEEVTNNKVTQDQIRELQHQSEFIDSLGEQQHKDLQDRLSASTNAILNLEKEVRHLDAFNQDEHVALMLSSIKNTSQRELAAYKKETEITFDRNVSMLKAQVDTDRKTYESVAAENRRLVCCVEELNTKIRNLQGELTHLNHSKCAADENLEMQKDCAARQSQALETKLSEMQSTVMDKMTELNLVKCENLPLKTESAGLRALINEEKERIAMDIKADQLDPKPATSHNYAPLATAALLTMDPFVPSTSGVPIASPAVVPGAPAVTPGTSSVAPGALAPVEDVQSINRFSFGHTNSTRAHSAPVTRQHRMSTEELGKGRSYFNELFKPRNNNNSQIQSAGLTRTRVHFDSSDSSKSSLGALTIHEISRDGRYIMLHNSSSTDMEFGNSSIKQNITGVPVTQFTFPKRMTFRAGSFITVFSGDCSSSLHQPPHQFVHGDQPKWGTGPECTTVLCNSSGKAVAWVNATQRQAVLSAPSQYSSSSSIQTIQMLTPAQSSKGLTESSAGSTVGLKRNTTSTNKENTVSDLDQQKRRPHTTGTICKSPITRPPHSASGQRMGSAPMRKYAPSIASSR